MAGVTFPFLVLFGNGFAPLHQLKQSVLIQHVSELQMRLRGIEELVLEGKLVVYCKMLAKVRMFIDSSVTQCVVYISGIFNNYSEG